MFHISKGWSQILWLLGCSQWEIDLKGSLSVKGPRPLTLSCHWGPWGVLKFWTILDLVSSKKYNKRVITWRKNIQIFLVIFLILSWVLPGSKTRSNAAHQTWIGHSNSHFLHAMNPPNSNNSVHIKRKSINQNKLGSK